MKTSAPEKILLTYEDYAAIPNDGRRYEIIGGDLFMSPSPKQKHQYVSAKLTRILGDHVEKENLGMVYAAPFDVLLTEHDIVQPDLIFVSKAQFDIITEDNIKGVPTLLIEILSPSNPRMDLATKRNTYARCRVPHYWIVDPYREQIEVFQLEGDVYARVAVVEGGAEFNSKPFPKLRFRLTRLWQ